ncbi:amp dependent CoA ligase [Annulohypoxylon maeteangense]|uniref:amp dependent CoA ligase n=1 Tax=Annulohypoxylon maeteangense TaxID=1927788 RepID=UPI0020078F0F|nr:amp dependent CoA ligase [Annulohypoxylon maeteangense]KAI0881675.1 amp dependent CoA ligase [Annulohypoxylon maeteangense]
MSNDFVFEGPTSSPLRVINIGQLLDESCRENPEKVALVSRWQGDRLTYQELNDSCRVIARRLLDMGVRPKDHIVVLAGNSIEYVQLFLATGAIGAIFSIINPTFTVEEVVRAVEFLEPKAIFIADRIGYRKNKPLLSMLSQLQTCTSFIVELSREGEISGKRSAWREFLQSDAEADANLLYRYWAKADQNDTFCIQFTSGTTGPRKAAMLSHRNLINNALGVGHRLGYTNRDVVCCCAPLFHCFALVCGVMSTIAFGGTVVLPSDIFLASASLEAISEDRCTVINAVPTMFQGILDHPDLKKHALKACLRTGIVAGSSLPNLLVPRLEAELGLRGLAYAYGMTELSCIVFSTNPSEVSLLDNQISVGTVVPHGAAKIVGSDLKSLPPGFKGELLVSGYLTFQGYYKNPEKTNETMVKDAKGRLWVRTGDTAAIDVSGRCTIMGRVKDMIKRGGENIFPRDIEEVLEQHPGIVAAAVVGIPDAYWGEIIGAFIQPASGYETKPLTGRRNLKPWLRNRIAPHKFPEHFFWLGDGEGIPDELPFNFSGKIMKEKLRTIACDLLQVKTSS